MVRSVLAPDQGLLWFITVNHLLPNTTQTDSHSHTSSHRFIGGAPTYMLVDAIGSLQDSQAVEASPASNGSSVKQAVDMEFPFFTPNKHFRQQDALPRAEHIKYPSSTAADELVACYFTHIHHTFPILQQQIFLRRYVEAMEQRHAGKPSKDSAFLSSLFAVFACGATLTARQKGSSHPNSPGGKEKEKQADSTTADFSGME